MNKLGSKTSRKTKHNFSSNKTKIEIPGPLKYCNYNLEVLLYSFEYY